MTPFYLSFGGCNQKLGPSLVDKGHGAIVGRQVFVSWAGLAGVQLTMQLLKNIFKEVSCTLYIGFQISAGGKALRADCKTLVFRPGVKKGWRAL